MPITILAWFDRESSNKFTILILAILAFQYAYLDYREIRYINTFFEDVIYFYIIGLAVMYVLNHLKKKKSFSNGLARLGLFGFQMTYFLFIIAYFFCRLYVGNEGFLLQIEEDLLSMIFFIMMIFIILFLFSAIISIWKKTKQKIYYILKILWNFYSKLVIPLYPLYLFWKLIFVMEEKGIIVYLILVYINFLYLNVLLIGYYKLRKKEMPKFLRFSKWILISFVVIITIYFLVTFAIRYLIS